MRIQIRRWQEEPRFVYLVQQGTNGPIKIGQTTSVTGRLSDLQGASPEPLHLRAILPDESGSLELDLHHQFASLRLSGEWFKPESELLAFIEAIPLGEPGVVLEKFGVTDPVRVKPPTTQKQCSDCRSTKDLDAFYRQQNGILGRMGLCIECYRRRYSKEYFTSYRTKNESRLKRQRALSRLNLKRRLIYALGGECTCCGEQMFEFLHVVAKGDLRLANYSQLAKSGLYQQHRVLCSNCWLTLKHNKYCPHRDAVI